MDVEIYITKQTELVKRYLKNTFKMPITNLTKIDDFLDIVLKNILSIKIWVDKLRDSNIYFLKPLIYLEEVISNLNQALILGITGFRVPAYVMMRRSLENIMSFLYYKDHPVEYFRKESGTLLTRIKDLQEYIKKYPPELLPSTVDGNKFSELLKKLIDKWDETYRDLSNYVHGSQKEYLDLKTYLESISPSDEILHHLIPLSENMGDIINALLIVFFFDVYLSMDETEKSLVRLSINNKEIKTYITDTFGGF